MVNNLTLFFGLLLLIFISSLNFVFQIGLLIILIFIGLIKKISIFHIFLKIKFFLLALLLIYTLSVPGEIIFYYYFISISYEGLSQAGYNILRLLNLFVLITIMMAVLPKNYLVAKIVKFAVFFRFLGLNQDRLAVRLFLTFEYFELFKDYQFKFATFTSDLKKLLSQKNEFNIQLNTPSVRLEGVDFIWVLVFILVTFAITFML
ncbi:MAG: hypothetical protein ISP79_01780 [Methylophilaceae bacterium]|nr:hypothetical protein [Methylophilaceae bacterium]MBL6728318.1 hypothetical protein [Methylophilaceae bacterium]MBL6790458.1 hypothetical protein [Methylophilaceae bacterium]